MWRRLLSGAWWLSSISAVDGGVNWLTAAAAWIAVSALCSAHLRTSGSSGGIRCAQRHHPDPAIVGTFRPGRRTQGLDGLDLTPNVLKSRRASARPRRRRTPDRRRACTRTVPSSKKAVGVFSGTSSTTGSENRTSRSARSSSMVSLPPAVRTVHTRRGRDERTTTFGLNPDLNPPTVPGRLRAEDRRAARATRALPPAGVRGRTTPSVPRPSGPSPACQRSTCQFASYRHCVHRPAAPRAALPV